MAEHAIPNPVEFIGEWSLPNASEKRTVSGSLSWSGSRATLSLYEALTPLGGAVFGDELHTYPVIQGVTVDSKLVSMLDSLSSGARLSMGPVGFRQRETIVSSWAVIGQQHVDPSTTYSEMRIRISGLQLWLGRSGMTESMLDPTEHAPRAVVYRIENVPKEEISVSLIESTLGWGFDRIFAGDLVSHITVTSAARLWLRPSQPMGLDWFFEQFSKVTTLLSLIAGSPMSPDHVSALVSASEAEVEVLVGLREAKYCEFKNAFEFFLVRDALDIDLGSLLNRWFETYESIAMSSQLALSVLNSEGIWLHVEFLSLMQALEGIHRALLPGTYTSPEKYEAIRQALCRAIPNDVISNHRESLKARIKYGNEVSLRKRLDVLVQRLSDPVRQQILGSGGTVPQGWMDTRNYYTHWDELSRGNVLDGASMRRACVRMKLLLRALYLEASGVPHAAIEKALNGTNRDSRYLIQLNNAEHRRRHPEDLSGALLHIDVKDTASPDDNAS